MKIVQSISKYLLILALAALSNNSSLAECGVASYYSSGAVTANGERYDHMGISAAHKTLPFGTVVNVKDQKTGRSITVRINDRGPFIAGRIIDLSTGAKNALGVNGLALVCLEVVSYGDGQRHFTTARLKQSAPLKAVSMPDADVTSARTGVQAAYAKRGQQARRYYRASRYGHTVSRRRRHFRA